jgi:amidase
VPRAFYYDAVAIPGEIGLHGGLNPEQKKVMAEAVAILQRRGAIVVDPADIPSVVTADAQNNLLEWNTCFRSGKRQGEGQRLFRVFKYGMKRDFNQWLASLGLPHR